MRCPNTLEPILIRLRGRWDELLDDTHAFVNASLINQFGLYEAPYFDPCTYGITLLNYIHFTPYWMTNFHKNLNLHNLSEQYILYILFSNTIP